MFFVALLSVLLVVAVAAVSLALLPSVPAGRPVAVLASFAWSGIPVDVRAA